MAIREIMVVTTLEHLGSDAIEADLDRYMDHLEAALTEAFPDALISVREDIGQTRIEADTDNERDAVEAFIEEHFNRGEWAR